ncbi:MAG: winged helix-turn-helix transcriptional regulator [Pseudomonadota bacterium]
MALLDLLGRRWALGVIWHLCESGPLSFRALAAKCGGVAPSVLNTRLKELRAAHLVILQEDGFTATERCRELFQMLRPLRQWSHVWADDLPVEDQSEKGQ